jgi:hypothetical protein
MNYLQDDKASIEEILKQAPEHVDYNQAKVAYYNSKRNISQALADLWNLPPLPPKKAPIGENAEKWTEIRQTCDEFDACATLALEAMRKNQQTSTSQHIQSPLVKSTNMENINDTSKEPI